MDDTAKRILLQSGNVLELMQLPTLTLGHKRQLFKQYGVDVGKMSQLTPEEEFHFVLYFARLLLPDTTETEIEALSINQTTEIVLAVLDSAKR